MALPRVAAGVVAPLSAVDKAVSSSVKSATQAATAAALGPEFAALKGAVSGSFGVINAVQREYARLTEATEENKELLAKISDDQRTEVSESRNLIDVIKDSVVPPLNTMANYFRELAEDADRLRALMGLQPLPKPTEDTLPQGPTTTPEDGRTLLDRVRSGFSALVGSFLEGLASLSLGGLLVKAFGRAFKGAALITLATMFRDDIADYLTTVTGSELFGEGFANAVVGAAIGSIFGPKGALIGALIGASPQIEEAVREATGSEVLATLANPAILGAVIGGMVRRTILGLVTGIAIGVTNYIDKQIEKLTEGDEVERSLAEMSVAALGGATIGGMFFGLPGAIIGGALSAVAQFIQNYFTKPEFRQSIDSSITDFKNIVTDLIETVSRSITDFVSTLVDEIAPYIPGLYASNVTNDPRVKSLQQQYDELEARQAELDADLQIKTTARNAARGTEGFEAAEADRVAAFQARQAAASELRQLDRQLAFVKGKVEDELQEIKAQEEAKRRELPPNALGDPLFPSSWMDIPNRPQVSTFDPFSTGVNPAGLGGSLQPEQFVFYDQRTYGISAPTDARSSYSIGGGGARPAGGGFPGSSRASTK